MSENFNMKRVVYAFFGIILLFIFTVLAVYFSNFSSEFGDQMIFGAFGDYMGGILNPVLSFFTICLLIISIHIQRVELVLTREELAGSKDQLIKGNELTAMSVKSQVDVFNASTVVREVDKLKNRFDEALSFEIIIDTPNGLESNPFFAVFKEQDLFELLVSTDENDRKSFLRALEEIRKVYEDLGMISQFIYDEKVSSIHYKVKLRGISENIKSLNIRLRQLSLSNSQAGEPESIVVTKVHIELADDAIATIKDIIGLGSKISRAA